MWDMMIVWFIVVSRETERIWYIEKCVWIKVIGIGVRLDVGGVIE